MILQIVLPANYAAVAPAVVLRNCLYPVAVVYPLVVFLLVYLVYVAAVAVVSLFSAACIPGLYHVAVCIFPVSPAIEIPVGTARPWVEPK